VVDRRNIMGDNVRKAPEQVKDSCVGCTYVGQACGGDEYLCDGTIFKRVENISNEED